MRVVSETGEQLGIMTKGDALKRAQEAGMDLVLVAPNINPPVGKIIDFAKFKFQQEKREQESKKKSKQSETKEVRLTPFMAKNDLMVRVKRAREFLKDNDKVRFNVWFRGRQMSKKQFGYDLLKKVMNELAGVGIVEQDAKFRGNVLQMTVKPSKQQATSDKQQATKIENNE